MMHRNSQKRYYDKRYVYFVTVNTFQNYLYFQEGILCELFIEELRLCKELIWFELYAFCLMCDHFHLMVKPHELANISKVVQFLKRHVSRNANIIMSPCVSDKDVERNIYNDGDVVEGDIGQCRLHENYYNDIDGKVNILRRRFAQKHKTHQPYSPFKWQKSYHDHIIRDEPDFEHHYRYTVYNYLKHNLHKNWEFTSLRYPGMVDQ